MVKIKLTSHNLNEIIYVEHVVAAKMPMLCSQVTHVSEEMGVDIN